MTHPAPGDQALLPSLASRLDQSSFPAAIADAGPRAHYAWDEFFAGTIRNPHTRAAYVLAVKRFLDWCQDRGLALFDILPGHVGDYLDRHSGSPATKKLHLSALRGFLDRLVLRHVLVLNPAASVRGEKHSVQEGKTPMISVEESRLLLDSLDLTMLVGLRDRAVLGSLAFTAARVGAIARLRVKDFYPQGLQYFFRMQEKNGKSREIPVRHDLARWILAYVEAAGISAEQRELPLFRSLCGASQHLSVRPLNRKRIWDMLMRRLRSCGLPEHLTSHSFRVKAITNLLEQGVPLEEVQALAGHADPRTTEIYDRRHRRVSQNLVERILG